MFSKQPIKHALLCSTWMARKDAEHASPQIIIDDTHQIVHRIVYQFKTVTKPAANQKNDLPTLLDSIKSLLSMLWLTTFWITTYEPEPMSQSVSQPHNVCVAIIIATCLKQLLANLRQIGGYSRVSVKRRTRFAEMPLSNEKENEIRSANSDSAIVSDNFKVIKVR